MNYLGIGEGFDVVIGNPPYIKERDNKNTFDLIKQHKWGKLYHQGKMDYWFYFLHRALDFTIHSGTISFITSRYWLNSTGSTKLIDHIRISASLYHIVDIGNLQVFQQVAGHHMLHFYQVGKHQTDCLVKRLQNSLEDISAIHESDNLSISSQTAAALFANVGEIRIYNAGFRLSTKVCLHEYYEVAQGIVQNPDKVSAVMARRHNLQKGIGVFVVDNNELSLLALTNDEQCYAHPFYDESAIQCHYLDRQKSKAILYITKHNCTSLNNLPNIKKHLMRFKPIMDARRETLNGVIDWFQLHWPREPRYFDSPKLVMPSMFREPKAAYVEESAYFGLGSNVIIGADSIYSLKLLCAILNSEFANWWFLTNGKQRGVGVDIGVKKLRQFPLPNITAAVTGIESRVDQILASIKSKSNDEVNRLKREVEEIIYELYGITDSERKTIEIALEQVNKSKKKRISSEPPRRQRRRKTSYELS